MPSCYDIYESYLHASDLQGKSWDLKIEKIWEAEVFIPNLKKKEKRIKVRFVSVKKILILNKTQSDEMVKIFKTDDYDLWVGTVTLSPVRHQSGKETIAIKASVSAAPAPTQQPVAPGASRAFPRSAANTVPVSAPIPPAPEIQA